MESQKLEWKKEWKTEYFREIAAFANSEGGILKIGIDDYGTIIGVSNPSDVMKKISDGSGSMLGIYPSIECDERTKVVTVTVNKSATPVELNGHFYIRSGNAVQEIKGRAYENLKTKLKSVSWMDYPVEGISIRDLDPNAISYFRDCISNTNVLSSEKLSGTDEELLTRLGMIQDGQVTRTCILLFHPSPEGIIFGSETKIGKVSGPELLFQDVLGGPLITRADRIMEILYSKYLIRPITYDGIHRVENDPYPLASLRETILNALVHNDYSSSISVHIRVWDDKIKVSDVGGLPFGWTLEKLMGEHISLPFNPKLADMFFISGLIENWGRGIEKVLKGYAHQDARTVKFDVSLTEFSVTLESLIPVKYVGEKTKDKAHNVQSSQLTLLRFTDVSEGRAIGEIVSLLGKRSPSSVSRDYVRPLLSLGMLEYTLPHVPKSPKQRYRTTELGRVYIQSLNSRN